MRATAPRFLSMRRNSRLAPWLPWPVKHPPRAFPQTLVRATRTLLLNPMHTLKIARQLGVRGRRAVALLAHARPPWADNSVRLKGRGTGVCGGCEPSSSTGIHSHRTERVPTEAPTTHAVSLHTHSTTRFPHARRIHTRL